MSSESEFIQDGSGIKSLQGFSFQIKVFCNLAAKLSMGKQIEFESIDDIAINKHIKPKGLDNINSKIITFDYESIQVKHTSLTNDLVENVLMNWIQIETSATTVSKYILITDETYNNKDLLKKININEFIEKVMNSNKKKNANITRVKKIFEGKSDSDRKKIIRTIINKKYDFKSINIDTEIYNNFEKIFHRSANGVVYFQRLDEFLSEITTRILKSVNSRKTYTLTYKDFELIVNDIIQRFSITVSLPSFYNFKSVNPIDLKVIDIANSREYKQLLYCEVPENIIRRYLLHGQYYRKVRSTYIDVCMESKCGDIENTAFENYEITKYDLQDRNEDIPKNRLNRTVKESNSYAENEQIREGACIYLTSDNINSDTKISWKDD